MNKIIEGNPRTGKTRFNTCDARLAFYCGMIGYSNYEICFDESHLGYAGRINGNSPCMHTASSGHYRKIDLDDLLDLDTGKQKMDISNGDLRLQEAYVWLESRSGGGTRLGRGITYFMMQNGKGDNNCTGDTQVYTALDLRFRVIAQYRIWAIGGKFNFGYVIFDREFCTAEHRLIDAEVLKGIYNFYDTKEKSTSFR